MKEQFGGFDKVSANTRKKLDKTLTKLKEDGFEVSETADEIILTIKDESGQERYKHFTKIGDELPVGTSYCDIENVVEASARYPNEDLETAIKKLQKEKKEKENI